MDLFASSVADADKIVSVLTLVEASSAICRLRRAKFLRPDIASAALTMLSAHLANVVNGNSETKHRKVNVSATLLTVSFSIRSNTRC